MQYSQEHLKTMVYAEFGGANRVYYGQLENREFIFLQLLCQIPTESVDAFHLDKLFLFFHYLIFTYKVATPIDN